jgi:WD40 repeat protein
MKVFHLSNKRVLLSFVHSTESSGAGNEPSADQDDGEGMDMDDEEGEGAMMANSIAVECVGFCNSNMPWVGSGGMDQNLKIWDLNNGQLRVSCAHESAVVTLKWHQTLPLVTTACLDHAVRIWDARDGTQVVMLTGHSQPITFLTSASFSLNEQSTTAKELEAVVSVADDSTARLFVLDLHNILSNKN